jgi:hypothetical protein
MTFLLLFKQEGIFISYSHPVIMSYVYGQGYQLECGGIMLESSFTILIIIRVQVYIDNHTV